MLNLESWYITKNGYLAKYKQTIATGDLLFMVYTFYPYAVASLYSKSGKAKEKQFPDFDLDGIIDVISYTVGTFKDSNKQIPLEYKRKNYEK